MTLSSSTTVCHQSGAPSGQGGLHDRHGPSRASIWGRYGSLAASWWSPKFRRA